MREKEPRQENIVRLGEVPKELEPYPQFVVWSYTLVDGKQKKPPFDPKNGHLASPTNPDTWGTLQQAQEALKSGQYRGMGFVFSQNDPYTGVDVDNCITGGKITPEAQELISELWSYTELSPSHTGLHILVEGDVPEGRRRGNIEMYSKERYFTLTTNHLKGSPDTIEDRQKELDRLYARLTPHPEPREHNVYARSRSTNEILKKAEDATNGASFTRLYNGDIAEFPSKSEADFTLILRLLYWTNDDRQKTRELFLQSRLVNEKTLSPRGDTDYLDYTIEQAIKKRNK